MSAPKHTYIDAQGISNQMAMNVRAKSLLIVTIVCLLAVASISSMTPAVATSTDDDLTSTPKVFCADNSQGSDWMNGCLRGEKFCMDEFPYSPAPSSDNYSEGYIAGWEHAGCTSQK